MTNATPATAAGPVWLVCLCAAWCRTCDGYLPVVRQVAAEFAPAAPGLRLRWIDIEDEAELVGDLDIETFPTLAIIAGDGVRFFGPLTPQPETLRRVLRAALQPGAAPQAVAAEAAAFAVRLRGLLQAPDNRAG